MLDFQDPMAPHQTGRCDPADVSLKSFFLGPQAENGPWLRRQVESLLGRWFDWRRSLFPQDGKAISAADESDTEFVRRRARFEGALEEISRRFEQEVPKFSPRYIGHMFSEVSLPGFLGHLVALLHNPNNISGESSVVGVEIENEAIQPLLQMVGFPPSKGEGGVGHFTSGGTVANFEAMIRARARCAAWIAAIASQPADSRGIFAAAAVGWEKFDSLNQDHGFADRSYWNFEISNPWETGARLNERFNTSFRGPVVLVPENKHYSWKKGVSLLGLGEDSFWPIELDHRGKLSVASLREQLEFAEHEERPVMMVVSVAGTTEMGQFDPIDEVADLLDEWRTSRGIHIWHHVDAAYGGFFRALDVTQDSPLTEDARKALAAMPRADSITLDPHKLGYVPYSCGAFVCRTRRDYLVKQFSAPYLKFDLRRDRGQVTLEGSRSATGAAATWMIERTTGLDAKGYGRIIDRTLLMRSQLAAELDQAGLDIRITPHSDSNIICFTIARPGESLASSNRTAAAIYERLSPQGDGPFFVSKTTLRWDAYGKFLDSFVSAWNPVRDTDEVVLVRLCLMNPFFNSKEMKTKYSQEFIKILRELAPGTPSGHP